MPSDVTREEFQHLATRTDILEREVEGEKMVTRHILEQTRRNGDDLAGIKTRLSRMDERLGNVEDKLEGVDLKGLVHKVDGLDRKFTDLTKTLPKSVGDAVREAFKASRGKR
jgi:hypothetical protein